MFLIKIANKVTSLRQIKGQTIIFLPGSSHFGKINCLHTRNQRKKLLAEKLFEKNCFNNTGKFGKPFLW